MSAPPHPTLAQPEGVPEGQQVDQALARISRVVQRALLRIEENRQRAGRRAAARQEKSPLTKEGMTPRPEGVTPRVSRTTTTTAQHSRLEDGHAGYS
jgi:hypothetical protein